MYACVRKRLFWAGAKAKPNNKHPCCVFLVWREILRREVGGKKVKLLRKWGTRNSLHVPVSSVFIRLNILHQLKSPRNSSTPFSHDLISNFFPFLCADECQIETVTLSCPTCWDGSGRCRRTSAGGWVGAGPSRCSAAPRGRARRRPTHTDTGSRRWPQSSCSEGISCWLPATAAQYQVYVQTEAPAAPTAWTLSSWRGLQVWPTLYFNSAGN